MFKKRREFIIILINLIKARVLLRKLLKNTKVGQSLSLKYYSPVLLKT